MMFKNLFNNKNFLKYFVVPAFLLISIRELYVFSNNIWESSKSISLLLLVFSIVLGDGTVISLAKRFIELKYKKDQSK